MSYDYEAKGSADFKTGKKDARLYDNVENHGASYRRGWQKARREAEPSQDAQPTPDPVKPPETPVTAEQVRLQTGEDKPKPKPADPDQLAFF